jgi:two-component system, LytTR family, response regulator
VRVLIVDDEAPARARLRRLLGAAADVDVVGEAADGAQALALAEALRPDALFLDVQMPEVNGFDVAASLPDDAPALVFVTAHDRYALQAFDTHAVDYLLKPVAPEKLERALQRLRAARRGPRPPSGVPQTLLIADRGATHVVCCADIEWLRAADNYVEVHVVGRQLLMRRTLAALLANLGPGFARCHRSVAVALDAIAAVQPRDKGDATLLLKSGAELPCSRQYRVALVARL